MAKNIIDKILNSKPNDINYFLDHSMAIVAHIEKLLEEKNLKKKDLAKLLGKYESEISKLLSGRHNFSLKTISKIENVLNSKIIFSEADINDSKSKQYVYVGNASEAMFRITEKVQPPKNFESKLPLVSKYHANWENV